MKSRVIVVPIIENNRNEYLICKMKQNRGVFPGLWALPGGGIEPNENMYDALKREIREELGIEIHDIQPWFFRDDYRTKIHPRKGDEKVYMIYLIFTCKTDATTIKLNDEFDEYKWVKKGSFNSFDLNEATKVTLKERNIY